MLFYIVGKDAIKIAIDFYKNEVIDYYKEVNVFLEDLKDENNQEEIRRIIANRVRNWITVEEMVGLGMDKEKADKIFLPYNLNLKEETIVNSDLFEYMIFELARIYKTIDLDNNVLMFCGY